MIYVSDVMGVMRNVKDPNSLIPTVNRENVAQLIEHHIIEGGMIPKVLSAVEALNEGVGKVHLIDGRTSARLAARSLHRGRHRHGTRSLK